MDGGLQDRSEPIRKNDPKDEEALINPTFSTWGNSGIESDAGISSLMKY